MGTAHRLDVCLAEVRARGWLQQAGELHPGTACLAVAVRSATGELVAGVVVTSARGAVPVEQLEPARECVAELAPLLS